MFSDVTMLFNVSPKDRVEGEGLILKQGGA